MLLFNNYLFIWLLVVKDMLVIAAISILTCYHNKWWITAFTHLLPWYNPLIADL